MAKRKIKTNKYLNNKLLGLSRGQKNMWIRQHRDMILDFIQEFGEGEAMSYFKLNKLTLETIIGFRGGDPFELKLSPVQQTRMVANTALKAADDNTHKLSCQDTKIERLESEIIEARKEIKELKELFNQFVESTTNQVAKMLIAPLLQSIIKFESNLEEVDPLVLELLVPPGYREYKKRKAIKKNPLLETIERIKNKQE